MSETSAFWLLVVSCLVIQWLIRACYHEWELHATREARAASHRKTFLKAPFWHYWSDGRAYFHVIAKSPAVAIDVLLRESTFAKVMDAEQDYL